MSSSPSPSLPPIKHIKEKKEQPNLKKVEEKSESLKEVSVRVAGKYEWDELNRATQMIMWFKEIVVKYGKEFGWGKDMIAHMYTLLILQIYALLEHKAAMEAPRGVSLEEALNIVEERLKELYKEQKETPKGTDIQKMLETIRNIRGLLKR